mmetsp:Transcript_30295/g.59982  ORF Transcript_30295/g.59982 Transcript_30295/m.59982 type:complete len:103 (-) Transcript_30295:53-361(-)
MPRAKDSMKNNMMPQGIMLRATENFDANFIILVAIVHELPGIFAAIKEQHVNHNHRHKSARFDIYSLSGRAKVFNDFHRHKVTVNKIKKPHYAQATSRSMRK